VKYHRQKLRRSPLYSLSNITSTLYCITTLVISNDAFLFCLSSLGAVDTSSGHIGDEFFLGPASILVIGDYLSFFCYQ
jgi:hypothetical protein